MNHKARSTDFFVPGPAKCDVYKYTRDSPHLHWVKCRTFIETLWRKHQYLLDPDAHTRARENMPCVFWELYLATALTSLNIYVKPLNRTKQKKKGPDFFATDPEVWIEAVLAQPGNGPDAMVPPAFTPNQATRINPQIDEFVLRLGNAFDVKSKKLRLYIEDGTIGNHQATVIAINSALLPGALSDFSPPRIVKALLGVGFHTVDIGTDLAQDGESYLTHQGEIRKKKGAPVVTFPFDDPAHNHVSAVIYSPSDWVNHHDANLTNLDQYHLGDSFITVLNSNAIVPLPDQWFMAGRHYWRQADQLFSKSYIVGETASSPSARMP